MSDQLHEDADELLHWLNTHSVRVSDGSPATHMQAMWLKSGRDNERLKTALEWLFESEMLSLSPAVEPPHLRFTPKGYLRLLAAMDEARLAAKNAAAGDDARPTRELKAPARPAPTPGATPVPAAAAPAPAAVAAPAPAPAPASAPAAAPAMALQVPSQPPAMAPAPGKFLDAGKAPTEIGLRNQILFIFRDLQLQAGQQLIAMTLSRYWQEMGLRAGDLRTGIDVLIRDGLVAHSVKRYENYWQLTAAGARYAYAPITPPQLLNLAEPLEKVTEGVKEASLKRGTHALFGKATGPVPFPTLLNGFRGDRNALLHGIDLLWKDGLLALHPGEPLAISLTEAGRKARF